MTSERSQSPLSSAYLRQYPKRFARIIGMNVENVDDLVQRISQLRLQELLATQVLWDADRTRRTSAQAVTSLSRSVSRFYISGNTWSKKFSVLALVLTKEV